MQYFFKMAKVWKSPCISKTHHGSHERFSPLLFSLKKDCDSFIKIDISTIVTEVFIKETTLGHAVHVGKVKASLSIVWLFWNIQNFLFYFIHFMDSVTTCWFPMELLESFLRHYKTFTKVCWKSNKFLFIFLSGGLRNRPRISILRLRARLGLLQPRTHLQMLQPQSPSSSSRRRDRHINRKGHAATTTQPNNHHDSDNNGRHSASSVRYWRRQYGGGGGNGNRRKYGSAETTMVSAGRYLRWGWTTDTATETLKVWISVRLLDMFFPFWKFISCASRSQSLNALMLLLLLWFV